jgi:hypothetical protein
VKIEDQIRAAKKLVHEHRSHPAMRGVAALWQHQLKQLQELARRDAASNKRKKKLLKELSAIRSRISELKKKLKPTS